MSELIKVVQLPVIEEQLRSMKEAVDQRVEEALSLVCTEETVQTVKSVRAVLNKEFQELEGQRKAVKNAVLGPYEQFERVYKECVSDAFKRADAALKEKIDDTESEIKNRCEAGLREFFDELCAAEHIDFLLYEQSGVKVDMASARQKTPRKLREQITDFVVRVSESVGLIGQMENAEEIMVEFKKTLDLPTAMAIVLERRRRMEEEQAAKAARDAALSAEKAAVAKVEAMSPPVRIEIEEAERKFEKFSFSVFDVTKGQLIKIREFLKQEGIRYE